MRHLLKLEVIEYDLPPHWVIDKIELKGLNIFIFFIKTQIS